MLFQNTISGKQIIHKILKHEKIPGFIAELLKDDLDDVHCRAFANYTMQHKQFLGIGHKNPGETVARINKALLREQVINTIKEKTFKKHLPFIHLAYYPKGFRTVATFRVDCDKSNQEKINNVYKHAINHAFPMTWFIEVAAQESFLKDIADFRNDGQDIQLHCYQHLTFKNYKKNKFNIQKGMHLMQEAGIQVNGYASPFGRWNPSLNQVLEELDFSFSSEFGMGYDDFPFFPVFKNNISKVLQIPVHPICIGSLRDKLYKSDEMIAYFQRVIQHKFERNSPIMLYGHPKNEIDQFPEVVDNLLSTLKNLPDIWITSYKDFSKWWHHRLSTNFNVEVFDDALQISTRNTDKNLRLHIEKADSTEAFIPLENSKVFFKDIPWKRKKPKTNNPTFELDIFHKKGLNHSISHLFSNYINKSKP